MITHENGALTVVDPQPPSTSSPDLLGDLLGTLAIEGPADTAPQSVPSTVSGLDVGANADALALAPVEEQGNTVQVSLSPIVYLRISSLQLCCMSRCLSEFCCDIAVVGKLLGRLIYWLIIC